MGLQREVTETLASRVAVLVFGVIQSVIVARYLLPEGRGQFATLMLLPQFVVTLAPLGLQWALIYHLRREGSDLRALLQNGLALSLLVGAGGFLVTQGASQALAAGFLAGLAPAAILAASLSVPVRVLQASWVGIFRGTERIGQANLLIAGRSALLLVVVAAALAFVSARVTALAICMLAVETAIVLVGGALIFRRVAPLPRLDPRVATRLLGYGLRVYVFSVLLFVNHRLDLALIRHFADYAEVGYYVTAVTLAEILWNLPNSLSFVLFPRIVAATPEERGRLTLRVGRATLAVMGAVCLAMAIAAWPLVRLLYGTAFLPAALPLIAILPGIAVMAFQQVIGADLAARGRPGSVTLAAAVGILVNLLLNLWWIPRLGAVGAALASTVSYTVVTAIALFAFLRASGAGLREALVLRAEDLDEARHRLRRLLGGAS